MALNDVFQATIGMTVAGQKIANVLHFRQSSADGSLPPNEDLAAAVAEDIIPTYQLAVSNDLNFDIVRAGKISPSVGGSFVLDVNVPGLVAQDTYPPNGVVIGTLYSDTLNQLGRGRIHISGLPDTQITNGRIANASTGLYVALFAKLTADIQASVGATFRPGIWSKAALAFYPITFYALRSRVYTLRSRRVTP